ncbi:MAG: MBL fold metallo-hydrolase [Chloroflexota bacterium]
MLLRLIYDDKLAQASYLVGCQATGDALIVDPNRDIQQYIALADREGFNITAVTETHIHADYLSGSRELAARTNAKLYLSDEGDDDWKYAFADDPGVVLVYDGDEFTVGNIRLRAMHTPGHTPEHISLLLTDTAGADEPMGVFTGDFVFVGDVGRPDLLETAAGFKGTMEAGAKQLYASLQRFKELPDYVQIWPGHGAGSACGKALGAVPQSTVGYEKLFNWAFRAETEEDFVSIVLEGQPEPPFYFAKMKELNKQGPPPAHDLPIPPRLPADEIERYLAEGTLIVDMRSNRAFASGHIPGTVNILHSKSALTWFGWIVSYDEPFALIIDEEHAEQMIRDLRLIGMDHVVGYWTPDVLDVWEKRGKDLQRTEIVDADDVAEAMNDESATVLDVRGSGEYAEGHIPGALNIPVGYLSRRVDEIPEDRPVVVHCQTGMRSSIAASVLERAGRGDIRNYLGSFADWERKEGEITRETEHEMAAAD